MTSAPTIAFPGAESRAPWRLVRELASSAEVSVGTVHFYVKQGLLRAPTPGGPMTKYDDEHFVKLQAITRLRREQRMKLRAIGAFFAGATPAQIVAAAGLEVPAAVAPVAPIEAVAPPRRGPYRAERAIARERWERVAICPGVELHVRADADDEAVRVAREIAETYAAR